MPPPIPRTLRIEPPRGWQGLKLADLWEQRELLFFLVWRDIKVRYKQTVLGAGWAVIQPLATTFVFALFFGRFGGLAGKVNGPYALQVFAALIPWSFFANSVSMSANSLVANSNLISKVYFPRLLIPVAPVISGLIDFGVAFVALLALMPVFGVPPGWQMLGVPLFLAGTVGVAAAAGILFSAVIVSYRDFRFVLAFLMQLWMFASPVPYTLEIVPERWRLLYAANPMVGMIAGFRASVLGEPFPLPVIVVSLVSMSVLLVAGLGYFNRVERRFADVI